MTKSDDTWTAKCNYDPVNLSKLQKTKHYVACLGNNNWTDLTKCRLPLLAKYIETVKIKIIEKMLSDDIDLTYMKEKLAVLEELYEKRLSKGD